MALCRECGTVIPCHCHVSPPVKIRPGVYRTSAERTAGRREMSKYQLVWGEPVPDGHGSVEIYGTLNGVPVARVNPAARLNGQWWVWVYLAPLPDQLDRMLDTEKCDQRQAKATAQRVVNAFIAANPATVKGVMVASAPPAIITSTSPRWR